MSEPGPAQVSDQVLAGLPPQVVEAVRAYAASRPALVTATEGFVGAIRELLDDAGINYLAVTGRTKTVESFAGKAIRERDGEAAHPDPLHDITDQIGVRVVTYVESDVLAAAGILSDQLTVLDDRDLGRETARAGRFGYASRHLLVCFGGGDEGGGTAYDPARCVSVQLRTVLQHAWAEFEHEIRYKGVVPAEHAAELDRRFTLAAGLLELADHELTAIRQTIQAGLGEARLDAEEPRAPRITGEELSAFLAGRYASAGWSRNDHYEWMSALLDELGIKTLDELSDMLRGIDSVAVTERMAYRYPAGEVRRLDDDLLARFGERYVALAGNAHRVDGLTTRLAVLRGEGGEPPA